LDAEACWLELKSNRFAPDFAPLRCATPGGRFWREKLGLKESFLQAVRMSLDSELQM
jgi:hypothetical protein